jgi:hypothetical protein
MPTSSFTGGNAGSGTNKNVNNVIYVQDNGNQNLDGYLTVSGDATLNSDLYVAGNTTLDGNLIVNGTTTTIDTATLIIEDPVITLAKNANVNPTATTDAGLFIQRGSTENPAILIWNETLNQFEVSTVTGATSATTNFTGGGVTKTFASFKGGDLYGSTVDITGVGAFGNITTGLLTIGEHNFDINGISLGEYGNLNIHSDQSYSSILLNYNVLSGIPTTNATIEVKRGSLTSALLKWNETDDAWDINNNLYSQKIKIRTDETSGSSSRVYIYFYHGTGMLNEVVYFYIYKTTDSGVTRKVVPVTIVTSSRIEAYTSNGYNAIKFNSNTPYSSHANADAFIDMEDGASYYINVYSPNSSGLAPTVSFSFRYTSNVGLSANYTTILNADYIASGGYNGLIQVNNVTPLVQQVFSAGTNVTNSIENLPSLSLEYSKGIASLVLNAGITDTPTDASILVDRGLSSPATLLWDESQTSWIINQDVRLSDGTNTPDLYLEDSSSIYLVDAGSVWINDGILALESRASNTTRIYLNSELGVGDAPITDAKITVNRGNQTNAEIKWDETNDRWDITHDLKVLDSSSNTTLLTNGSFIYTYKPLSLNNSLFYKVQRISSTLTNINSDVSFVVMENGALGSAVFQPLLPDLDSDTIGGRVINIVVKGANYVEIYPATISQYIRHGGTTYSSGNPLVLSGYSSVQLVSHIVGSVKDWYVTAISNSDKIDYITTSGALAIFNGKTYHCNPVGTIALTLGVAPNGTQLTFRSISAQTTTITTASNGIEGAHNTITLNSNSEGLSIYYYGTSWWISNMYGNVGITTV